MAARSPFMGTPRALGAWLLNGTFLRSRKGARPPENPCHLKIDADTGAAYPALR